MDELKLLIEAVAGLPTMTLWVLVGYLIYKLAVIGSTYSLVRFSIEKVHNYMVKPKHELVDRTIDVKGISITTDGTFDRLTAQLHRIVGKRTGIASRYIHDCSVDWLREAIDAKEVADARAKEAS